VPQILATLPAYNEEESLAPLLDKFAELELPDGWHLRMLLIDDGSKDRTVEIAEGYKDRLKLEVVQHEVNRGLGAAIRTGINEALVRAENPDEDIVVCMDADNTHHPKYILNMIPELDAGADLVIASRYQPGSEEIGVPGIRRVYSRGARLLFWMLLRLPGVRDYTCGYRAYRVNMLQKGIDAWGDRLIEGEGFACTDELLVKLAKLKLKPTIKEIPFSLRYDLKQGGSKLPLFKTILGTLHLCISSNNPPNKK
jgi:dolichol-phosphate mannosyltransferase